MFEKIRCCVCNKDSCHIHLGDIREDEDCIYCHSNIHQHRVDFCSYKCVKEYVDKQMEVSKEVKK